MEFDLEEMVGELQLNDNTHTRYAVSKSLYDHTKFNEAIEILIKMLDRLDHFDRIFIAQERE